MRGKSGNPIMSSYFSVGMSMAGNMFDENLSPIVATDSR